MQHSDFKNSLIQLHFMKLRESHNLVNQFANEAENNDKNFILDPTAKTLMGWPAHVNSMYDYRKMWGVDYERLMHLCIITLCSELEYMFRAIFAKYNFSVVGNPKGFYQRFNDVITALENAGIDFTSVQTETDFIKTAFQVRHICIHNLGIADQDFVNKTGLGTPGQTYILTQQEYIGMVDAAFSFQKLLDDQLP